MGYAYIVYMKSTRIEVTSWGSEGTEQREDKFGQVKGNVHRFRKVAENAKSVFFDRLRSRQRVVGWVTSDARQRTR